MNFPDRLYELRRSQGLSQEQLADLCNVSRQAVSKWENGSANPDLNNIKTLASVLQVSVSELLGECDTQSFYGRKEHHTREYVSSIKIGNIPLVHICFGWGKRGTGSRHIAKGIIAIGNVSIGIVSIGFLSAGLFSIGILAFGIVVALGCLSLSYLALGALAIGYIAIGALAIGAYSIGAISIGFIMSIGAVSYGTTAIGSQGYTFGEVMYYIVNETHGRSSCMVPAIVPQTSIDVRNLPFIIEVFLKHLPLC